MATLNTLRTKFGIVLSIIIALALLAFILSLKNDMGFSNNNPKVGEIAGDKITYTDYYDEYEEAKSQNGNDVYDEAVEDRINAAAWQSLIAKHAMLPGFESMGLAVTESERMSMLSGEHPSGVYYSAFANPSTGEYDVAAIADFLSQADANPQMQNMWNYINSQALLERELSKYMGLVKGGTYVNALEVKNGVHNANHTYAGKIVSRKYSTLADSLFTVSATDLKNYYNEHKAMFKQQPSRSISYVLFEVNPTQADMEAIEAEVRGIAAEFAAADDVRAFVRQNRRGSLADGYVGRAQMSADEADALLAGQMYGPILENDTWKIARAVETKTAPDSLGLRHIVLSYEDENLADSLLTALKGGADFAEAARNYSIAQTAVNGGELGVMPFSALPKEFADVLADAKKGDKVKIQSGNIIQLLDVYRAGNASKFVSVASIEYPVEASQATKRAIHNSASSFTVNAKGSTDKFNAAAAEAAVTPRIANIPNGERAVRGLDRSHEIVRWAYGAKVGDVSEIFNIGKDYVVAILTEIDDNEYRSLNAVQNQVRTAVIRDKKYDRIVSETSGATIDAVASQFGAEIADFSDVNYASYYIPNVGFEPRLVGAISGTETTGTLSAPIKGSSGVYYFVVDEIADSEKQSADAERVRLQATSETMAQQAALFAVQELAKVKDLRSRYF